LAGQANVAQLERGPVVQGLDGVSVGPRVQGLSVFAGGGVGAGVGYGTNGPVAAAGPTAISKTNESILLAAMAIVVSAMTEC
jgi:hypothetical protein